MHAMPVDKELNGPSLLCGNNCLRLEVCLHLPACCVRTRSRPAGRPASWWWCLVVVVVPLVVLVLLLLLLLLS